MYKIFGVFLIFSGWLLPNTSRPWVSFWQEAITLLGLLVLSIGTLKCSRFSIKKYLAYVFFFMISILWIDFIIREEKYIGDYIVGTIYIFSLYVAIDSGRKIQNQWYMVFFIVIFFSSVSALIAIAQWLQLDLNRLYFIEHPQGARAFANTGQANHLGTLLAWGVLATTALSSARFIQWPTWGILLLLQTFAIALTQSRTAFLGVTVASLFVLIFKYFKKIEVNSIKLLMAPVIMFLYSVSLPWVNNKVGLMSDRNVADYFKAGTRLIHWDSMLHAIQTAPLIGYGWLRSAKAQLLETDHAVQESIFQYAHNILIDVALWFGLPTVILLSCFLLYSGKKMLKEVETIPQIFSLAAAIIFLIHCLLEYPFAYLYMLIPFGLFIGFILSNQVEVREKSTLCYEVTVKIILAILSIIVVADYVKIESASMALRFKYLNIGKTSDESTKANVLIMDQAKDLMNFSYRKPGPEITEDEANSYGIASNRFGTQRLLFHSALAFGFVGEIEKSQYELKNICRIFSLNICLYTKSQWKLAQEEYPNSIGKIVFPN